MTVRGYLDLRLELRDRTSKGFDVALSSSIGETPDVRVRLDEAALDRYLAALDRRAIGVADLFSLGEMIARDAAPRGGDPRAVQQCPAISRAVRRGPPAAGHRGRAPGQDPVGAVLLPAAPGAERHQQLPGPGSGRLAGPPSRAHREAPLARAVRPAPVATRGGQRELGPVPPARPCPGTSGDRGGAQQGDGPRCRDRRRLLRRERHPRRPCRRSRRRGRHLPLRGSRGL